MQIPYTVVYKYSRRKTISISVPEKRTVEVRLPYRATKKMAQSMLDSHEAWIQKRLAIAEECGDEPLSEEEIQALAAAAKNVIPKRVAYYAALMGVSYGKIRIGHQKSRWGSCTREGNLSFNCYLMRAPQSVLDSIIVHELCHRVYMNHSRQFYDLVLKYDPDYWQSDAWLKRCGKTLAYREKKEP